jgi:hypothetical protein
MKTHSDYADRALLAVAPVERLCIFDFDDTIKVGHVIHHHSVNWCSPRHSPHHGVPDIRCPHREPVPVTLFTTE